MKASYAYQWYRASNDDYELYKQELDHRLESIHTDDNIHNCSNLECSNKEHLGQIDTLLNNIISAIQQATAAAIPRRRTRGGRIFLNV